MRIALVHFAAPPVVGGVERIIEQQARILLAHGHEVLVMCGNQGAAVEGAEILVVPELAPRAGPPTPIALRALENCEAVWVHNLFTMPFNWKASQALAKWSREPGSAKMVNWVHDMDVTRDAFHGLRLGPKVRHVAVSELRRREFRALTGLLRAACAVIPNGIDAVETLGLSSPIINFAKKHQVLERDLVLFHPTRILARKNIALGAEVIAAMRQEKNDAILIITGAADPHRKESAAYAAELRSRIAGLRVQPQVIFAGDETPIGNSEVAELYRLADALFFPSLREGFGLPLLEATVHRLPVFCSDIPTHREVLGRSAHYFKLQEEPASIAKIVAARCSRDPAIQRRKAILRKFGWAQIYEEHLEPLLRSL